MKKIILVFILLQTIIQASEVLDTNNAQNESTFFIRGGIDFINGTAKIRHKEDTAIVLLHTAAMIGNALEFVVGYEDNEYSVRYCINMKHAYENIEQYSVTSTRYMGGIEGFNTLSGMNLNYGVLVGGGKGTFKLPENTVTNDLVSFLGIEAYVGADGEIQDDFGYYVKVAYDVKGYDSVNSTDGLNSFRDDLVVYNMSVGVGLSYKF